MADVRSLLRQQRAARRINHPHAAYSDAGKLLCTVCHELVKTESLWEGHVRGAAHRQRLQEQEASGKAKANGSAGAANGQKEGAPEPHGRKHGRAEDDDDEMDDGGEEEAVRKKRSRADMARPLIEIDTTTKSKKESGGQEAESKPASQSQTPTLSPPFTRRTSGTPVQGVELKIPSRPATPNPFRDGTASGSGGQASAASTPKIAPVGRSPLIPQEATATEVSAAATKADVPLSGASQDVDEAEWAAFEAEVVNATPLAPAPKPSDYFADPVISAAPMSAEEIAARSEEEERAKRRAVADVQMEDEKEEATRALETEFEEMEVLEARVKRLKEKREALRQHSGHASASKIAVPEPGPPKAVDKEKENIKVEDEEEDDEDMDDDDDDWVGFRFRAQ